MNTQGHEVTEGPAEMPDSPEPDTSMWLVWWTIIQPDGSFQEAIHAVIPGSTPDAEALAQAQTVMAEKMAEVLVVPMVRQLHTLSTSAAEQLRATIRGGTLLGRAAEPTVRISAALFPDKPHMGIPLGRQVPQVERKDDE